MYTILYVHGSCGYIYIYIYVYTHSYMHAYVHTLHTYIIIYIYIHMYICMYTHTFLHILCVYICISLSFSLYMYIYIYISTSFTGKSSVLKWPPWPPGASKIEMVGSDGGLWWSGAFQRGTGRDRIAGTEGLGRRDVKRKKSGPWEWRGCVCPEISL